MTSMSRTVKFFCAIVTGVSPNQNGLDSIRRSRGLLNDTLTTCPDSSVRTIERQSGLGRVSGNVSPPFLLLPLIVFLGTSSDAFSYETFLISRDPTHL